MSLMIAVETLAREWLDSGEYERIVREHMPRKLSGEEYVMGVVEPTLTVESMRELFTRIYVAGYARGRADAVNEIREFAERDRLEREPDTDGYLGDNQDAFDSNAECGNCHTALREHDNWECPPRESGMRVKRTTYRGMLTRIERTG